MTERPRRNPVRLRRGFGGFTLLEVMIALAIFAMAAIVLGAAYLNIINNYTAVSRGVGEDQDVAFARQELLTQPDLTTAQNGDEFDTADPAPALANSPPSRHIKWTAEIDPTTTADLFTVTFTCVVTSTAPQLQPKTVVETFMLLRPTWSDPTDRSNLRQAAASRIAVLQGKASQ